jgi:hypothetical protein
VVVVVFVTIVVVADLFPGKFDQVFESLDD